MIGRKEFEKKHFFLSRTSFWHITDVAFDCSSLNQKGGMTPPLNAPERLIQETWRVLVTSLVAEEGTYLRQRAWELIWIPFFAELCKKSESSSIYT